jgi:hypothetical protein
MDWIQLAPLPGSCENDKKASASAQRAEFLDRIRNCQILTKDSAPMNELRETNHVLVSTTTVSHVNAYKIRL